MDAKWIFVDETVGNDFTRKRCDLCLSDVSGPFYTREVEERAHYLHKACADLPEEMEHKLHPGHKLIQLDKVGYSLQLCNCCDEDGFPYYKCSDCNDFVLAFACAVKSFPITHKCHPHHPLIPIYNDSQLPRCVVCRLKRYGSSYECTICAFEVHQDCVSSRIVKLQLHCHDVKFIHSVPADNHLTDELMYCHTCEQDMEEGDFAYHCATCRYFFHTYNCGPMVHSGHPEHQLNLVNGKPYPDSASITCNGCGTHISAPYCYCNAKYDTTKEVWDHLARLYTQPNFAKQYQFESDIRALHQKSMSIQEFYTTIVDLWDQLALTESAELKACTSYIAHRENQRLVQFLMALRDEFEQLRGGILHRHPLPSIDSVVSKLLAEEIRLKNIVEKVDTSASGPPVFAASGPSSFATSGPSIFSVSSKEQYKPVRPYDECAYCKGKGHWKAQCPHKQQRQGYGIQASQLYQPRQHG